MRQLVRQKRVFVNRYFLFVLLILTIIQFYTQQIEVNTSFKISQAEHDIEIVL